MTPALDSSDPALLYADRLALARLWPLDTDGAGWWRWTSPDLAVRDSYVDPPRDDSARGHWSRRGVVAEDSRFSGEMEAR